MGKGGRPGIDARTTLGAQPIAFRVLCVPEDREELRHDARVVTCGVSDEATLLLRTLPGAQFPRR